MPADLLSHKSAAEQSSVPSRNARDRMHGGSEPEDDPLLSGDILEQEHTEEGIINLPEHKPASVASTRIVLIRTLALLCACSLSIGSHYASYILGPLKSRIQRELGTTHTEFGLLFSAFSLNSTWTPLVGGLLASTLGTTLTSILATSVVFLGQLLLLIGDLWGNVRLMALGLFIFGFGVSPLAVVQETIIVRFFKSHGLGVSMAFGLIAGKGASFISARTSYPLTEHFGPHAPFYVATLLTGLSVVMNLVYTSLSRWLIDNTGAELEASDFTHEARKFVTINVSEAQALERVAERKRVHLNQIPRLGDVFWAYILLNLLCGTIWSPFTHLSANIIEKRYGLGEEDAAVKASYVLSGSLVLYPLCGFLVDIYKRRSTITLLLLLSSTLTGFAYVWLALPPTWTNTPVPAIWSFAIGYGFSPLLLVVIVPKIVPSKYVSTALGAHKSLEQTGSTLFQTLAGLGLDLQKKDMSTTYTIQRLLNTFLILNILHFGSIWILAYMQQRKIRWLGNIRLRRVSSSSAGNVSASVQVLNDQRVPLLLDSGTSELSIPDTPRSPRDTEDNSPSEAILTEEVNRGRIFAFFSVSLIAFAWILFLITAYFRLGREKNSPGTA